jgi:hypothetical protein
VVIKKAVLTAEEKAGLKFFPRKIAGRPDRIQQWLKGQPEWVVLREIRGHETRRQ